MSYGLYGFIPAFCIGTDNLHRAFERFEDAWRLQVMENLHAIPSFTDNSRLLQYRQMPGDVGLVNVNQFVQLAHTPVAIRQSVDDQHADRMR